MSGGVLVLGGFSPVHQDPEPREDDCPYEDMDKHDYERFQHER